MGSLASHRCQRFSMRSPVRDCRASESGATAGRGRTSPPCTKSEQCLRRVTFPLPPIAQKRDAPIVEPDELTADASFAASSFHRAFVARACRSCNVFGPSCQYNKSKSNRRVVGTAPHCDAYIHPCTMRQAATTCRNNRVSAMRACVRVDNGRFFKQIAGVAPHGVRMPY